MLENDTQGSIAHHTVEVSREMPGVKTKSWGRRGAGRAQGNAPAMMTGRKHTVSLQGHCCTYLMLGSLDV